MVPIKGQLAMLPPQAERCDYLYGQDGYMFPRSRRVVIGGTFEEGVNNEIAEEDEVRRILSGHVAIRLRVRSQRRDHVMVQRADDVRELRLMRPAGECGIADELGLERHDAVPELGA